MKLDKSIRARRPARNAARNTRTASIGDAPTPQAGVRSRQLLLRARAQVVADNGPITIPERIFLADLLGRLPKDSTCARNCDIDARKVGHNPIAGGR